MGKVLALILAGALVVGGVSATQIPGEPLQPDTAAAMLVAFHHHYPDLVLDSVAFDTDRQAPWEVELTKRIAERLRRPVVRSSDVLWCEEELRYPRHCGLTGFNRLVRVQLELLQEDRAIVRVGSTLEVDGHVWAETTAYELQRVDTEWAVTRALWSAAT